MRPLKIFFTAIITLLTLLSPALYGEEQIIYAYLSPGVQVEDSVSMETADIEDLAPQDLPSLLEYMGITIKSSGGYGSEAIPSIRGFTGSSVKVYVNGMEVNSAQNGTYDFSTFPVESIERIQVVKGAFNQDVQTQSGNGGIIYITTKKQALGHHFKIDTRVLSYLNSPTDTYRATAGYNGQIDENTFCNITGALTYAKNAYLLPNNKPQHHNGLKEGKGSTSITKYYDGWDLSLSDEIYAGTKEFHGTMWAQDFATQNDINNNLTITADFPLLLEGIKFTSSAAWKTTNQYYKSVSEESLHKLNTVNLTGALNFEKSNSYTLGWNVFYDDLRSTDTDYHNVFRGTIKDNVTLYLSGNWSLVIPVALSFMGKDFSWIPGVGAEYALPAGKDNLFKSFYINCSRMHLFPNLNQLYWKENAYAKGNPNLKPEDGLGAEVGTKGHIWGADFTFTVFSNYYQNKIQWAQINGVWSSQNAASAFYAGFDLTAQKNWNQNFKTQGSWEYCYNRLLAQGITHGKRIMYTPANTGTFTAIWSSVSDQRIKSSPSIPVWTVATSAHFTGKRYISNLNGASLTPYLLWDLNITWKRGLLELYASGKNLLNMQYQQTDGYPMPGRSIEIGLKLKN